MAQRKITPTNIKTGNTAPSFFIEVGENDNTKKIDQIAREKSGLGKFKEWKFYC